MTAPVDRNDLKGEATIVAASTTGIDARGYNAIGIQAIAGQRRRQHPGPRR